MSGWEWEDEGGSRRMRGIMKGMRGR